MPPRYVFPLLWAMACDASLGAPATSANPDGSSDIDAQLPTRSTDGGGGDGSPTNDGAVSASACEGRLICDDFESYAAGAAPKGRWKVSNNTSGTVRVDATRAYSGTKSVHVTTDGKQSYQSAFFYVEGAPTFPVNGNVVFGRMMIWLKQAPNDGVHWTMIQGEGPVSGKTFTSYYRYGGQHTGHMMANYETIGASTDCWQHSNTLMPTGKWACMEWRFNGPNNELNFWLDGTAVTDLTVVDKGMGCLGNGAGGHWYAPTVQRMSVGWESYQTDPARELWIDDVAFDTARLGCPAAK